MIMEAELVGFEREILSWGGEEVSALDVYSDMFSLGDNLIQKQGEVSPKNFPKSNPLVYFKYDKHVKGQYRILLDDTFADILHEAQEADFAITNGISYFGRKNLQERANKMFAMIFDLDGTSEEKLGNFLSGAYTSHKYPIPNYIVLSGHGVHLYYLFEYPIPLYPKIKLQLKELKYALTKLMWNNLTSTIEKPQYQGINQGFRLIGGKTKIDGVRTRAFRLNHHPFNLENLSEYVPAESRIDESKIWKEKKLTLEEASKLYPEWYAEVEKWNATHKGKNKKIRIAYNKGWVTKRDLYDWWIRQIKFGAVPGHRYFCIMALAIYAVKAGITREELEKDAYALIPMLNGLVKNEPFTKADCDSALECYDHKYITFPRKDIQKITGIEIAVNKRNHRNQRVHLKGARALQNAYDANGNWRNKYGAPTKEALIKEFIKTNPDKNVTQIARELGVSRPTVYKYMKKE